MSMIRFRLIALATALMASTAMADEPSFSPPPGWVESAPAGMVDCQRGSKPQLTLAEYRKFGARSQVWPQRELVEADWTAGGVRGRPASSELRGMPWKKLRAEVVVLVGPRGEVVDKVIKCSNMPETDAQVLANIDHFSFAPSTYKGRELVVAVPVVFQP